MKSLEQLRLKLKPGSKVLVTGGNGFIGGYVTAALVDHDYIPIVFTNRTNPKRVNQLDVEHFGDVRDYTSVSEAVGQVDGVIHLAGVLGTQETVREPVPAVETNILGSLNVFKACEHYKTPCVYICVGNHWMENTYSITKTTAERFARMFNKEHGTDISIVRGLNVYGPGQKAGPVRKIMPNFIIPTLKCEDAIVYGDGMQIMDMIHVTDMAEVLVRALVVDHLSGATFEAGTRRRTTVIDILQMVMREADNQGYNTLGESSIRYVTMRPGETERSVVIGDPATLEPLGIYPVGLTTLEEGLKGTVTYYADALGIRPILKPGQKDAAYV